MAILVDDRTEEQKRTHTVIIAATDTFMSGWGQGVPVSYAGWACQPKDARKVESWVRARGDMKNVREVLSTWRPRIGHTHIYVVDEGHPALR